MINSGVDLWTRKNWKGSSAPFNGHPTLLTGLVSYWKLEETSGTRVDAIVATGNDLTDNNTVTSATGIHNTAAFFTNANSESLSRVDPATLEPGAGDFTAVAWVNAVSLPVNHRVVGKQAAGEDGWVLGYSASRFRVGNLNSGLDANDGGAGVSTGVWYCLIGLRESGTWKLRVNGTEFSGSSGDSTALNGTGPFRIGARNAVAAEFWDGIIDEVGYWSRALTAQERIDLYNGGTGLFY